MIPCPEKNPDALPRGVWLEPIEECTVVVREGVRRRRCAEAHHAQGRNAELRRGRPGGGLGEDRYGRACARPDWIHGWRVRE